MATLTRITPCLWFDTQGEEAADFYTGIFKNSRISSVARYTAAGPRPEGTVMMVTFELDGQEFIALNGGPEFTFDEAISLQVELRGPGRDRLLLGRCPRAARRPCGWLKDKFGLSWQIAPNWMIGTTSTRPIPRSSSERCGRCWAWGRSTSPWCSVPSSELKLSGLTSYQR